MKPILVTGATGNVGRPLITQLVEAGAEVRAVTRNPDGADLPAAVTVVRTAAEGLPGAGAVFLNSRALGDDLGGMVKEAVRQGVTRLIALSAINVDDDFSRQPSRFRGDRNKEAEQLAVDSGLEWVSLRPTMFATNFFNMWAPQIQIGDVVDGPYAAASTAPIVEGDIAAVAASALLTDDVVGRRIPLTSPEAFTNRELVDVIGEVLGRRLSYREVAPGLVRQRFVGLGFPQAFADAYLALLEQTLDKPALVTHEIDKILGRPAKTFASAVAAHRELFTKH